MYRRCAGGSAKLGKANGGFGPLGLERESPYGLRSGKIE